MPPGSPGPQVGPAAPSTRHATRIPPRHAPLPRHAHRRERSPHHDDGTMTLRPYPLTPSGGTLGVMAAFEVGLVKTITDPGYIAILAKAEDLFVEGTTEDTIIYLM